MTDRLRDDQLDREISNFLALRASEIANAPSAAEMAARISSRVGTRTAGLRLAPQLVWVVLAGLLIAALIGAVLVGARLLRNDLPPSRAGNGWIAFSNQPGYPQVGSTDVKSGGDVYLVREGVEPTLIVSRGRDKTSNVCPAFSPDGSKLVYGERAGSLRALVFLVVSADGAASETARLQVAGAGAAPCPQWSADGSHVVYLDRYSLVYAPSEVLALVVRGLDGSTLVPGPSDPSVDDLSPTVDGGLLSPSRDWMAFTDDRGLVVSRPDGSDARILMSPFYAIAAWSPDGRKVLAMQDVSGSDFTMFAILVESPFEAEVLAPFIGVNGARSWPGRGDVSWQAVFP